MRTAVQLVFGITLVHAAVAQQTLVVDPNGSGQFATLAAALAVAAPGDTVLLRGGIHNSAILGVPIQIVGDPAYARPTISGVDIAANGCVSLVRVFVISTRIYSDAALDDVTGLACAVHGGNVVMSGCSHSPDNRILAGNVVMNRCTLAGRNAFRMQSLFSCVSYPALPGLDVVGGTVALANCTLTGGGAGLLCNAVPGPAAPALRIQGGAVQATRSQLAAGAGAAAVTVGAGSFAYDPSTAFAGTGAPPGNVLFLPATDGTGALAGGVMTVQLQTQPGVAALVAGSVGCGTPVPTPFGPLWFDPAAHVVLTLGATDASGVLTAAIPVPPAVQRGTTLTLQGGAIAPGPGTATAGTPVVLHVQ